MATVLDAAASHERAPETPPNPGNLLLGRIVTALLVVGPVVALAIAIPLLWGHAVHLRDVILAVAFYLVSGFGVTVGYHRLFTHRSFRASRWLRIVLASAGSLAVEGLARGLGREPPPPSRLRDKPGDPHSPQLHGATISGQLRGFAHAHVGWLFKGDVTSAARYAPELLEDADTRIISRLFPFFAVFSLAAPFFLGWTLSGAIGGALTALLWAGLARMMLLHHVTWSVNSICHMFGRAARDAEGPQHQLRAARDHLVRRGVAQLPPRAPGVGAPRCAAAPDRPVGRADPSLRTRGLGIARALADRSATLALPIGLTCVFPPRPTRSSGGSSSSSASTRCGTCARRTRFRSRRSRSCSGCTR